VFPSAANEQAWVKAYVANRLRWLQSSSGDLPATAYRMKCFQTLISIPNWQLDCPIVIRGQIIGNNDGAKIRVLHLIEPPMTGPDVIQLQNDLNTLRFKVGSYSSIDVDGSFGPQTKNAVEKLQSYLNLISDGIAGTITLTAIANALKPN
jgi:hypothetical protein